MTGNFRLPVSSGSGSGSTYVRPSDWLTLPTVISTDQKVVLLHAVFNHDSNFCAFQCASNYTVNWGDGTSNNYAANVSAYHVYDYNYAGFVGTESTRGYRQAIVTITPQATFNLTKLDLGIKHNQTGLQNYSSAWLDIKMAGTLISTLVVGAGTIIPKMLEIFNFLSTNSLTSGATMFSGCVSLSELTNLYTNGMTSMYSMFQGCNILKTIPLLITNSVTDMMYMFLLCPSLQAIPLLNTANVTNMSSMFNGCYSLTEIPLLNTANVTTMNGLFTGCTSLQTIPLLNTTSVVNNMNGMFQNCVSLQKIPEFNAVNVLNSISMFSGCASLSKISILNIKMAFNISSLKMSKTEILKVFENLQANTTQTVTITGNWGADTAISKTSCGTTAGSTVVTQSNTASLAIGMLVLGTGISTAIAVSFQDTGDTVTLNNHGLSNGNIVSFPSITTTTGITINTPYYVVNATTNTFQVSLTLGGSVIVLTTDGTGTVAYGSYIQSIITNTSFTLDKPASATGTVTLTSRILDTSIATLKGWTVTG